MQLQPILSQHARKVADENGVERDVVWALRIEFETVATAREVRAKVSFEGFWVDGHRVGFCSDNEASQCET